MSCVPSGIAGGCQCGALRYRSDMTPEKRVASAARVDPLVVVVVVDRRSYARPVAFAVDR